MADEAEVKPPNQNFFLTRELDQAYLLLDHITMSETKFLPPANAPSGDVVAQISAVRYPPQGTAPELAVQAATLMRAVDALNHAATPANGLTVAFTLLVAGEDEAVRSRETLIGPNQAPNRLALAVGAFPTLVGPARRFKRFYAWMIAGLISLFIITLLLSWYVATGTALLGQLTAGETAYRDVSKQITAAQLAEYSKGPPPTAGSQPAVVASRYCSKFRDGPLAGANVEALDSTTGFPPVRSRQLVDRPGPKRPGKSARLVQGGPFLGSSVGRAEAESQVRKRETGSHLSREKRFVLGRR